MWHLPDLIMIFLTERWYGDSLEAFNGGGVEFKVSSRFE